MGRATGKRWLFSPPRLKEATPLPSTPFVFPGQTAYLEAAAEKLGQPGLARAAGRLVALSALANLCAQASRANPADVVPILAKAGEFRDQLAIALEAADAMLAEVESSTSPAPDTSPIETPAASAIPALNSTPPPLADRLKGRRS